MAMSRSPGGRTGRRSGPTQTRDAIAAAARSEFAERGYDRATIRAIAARAGVDPALVVHFHGAKESLFRDVMAVPGDIAAALEQLSDGPPEAMGRRLAQVIVGALENPGSREIVIGRIRSASSHPDAAELVRQAVSSDILRLATAVSDDRPQLRATLIGTQLVGLAVARYIVAVEPLASLSADALVDVLAPTLQHYLTGPLDSSDL